MRRELLLDLAQSAAETIAEYARRELGERGRPGIVVSIAAAGDMVQWHPHGRILTTATPSGTTARSTAWALGIATP